MARLILHVSDWTEGGAARAAARLQAALRQSTPHTVRWLACGGPDGAGAEKPPAWTPLGTILLEKLVQRLERRFRAGSERCLHALMQRTCGRNTLAALERLRPAVLHLHNLHRVLGWSFLEQLPAVPLVWTLHDMWPLTGYCCFSGGCEKYRDGCAGTCPEMGRWGPALRAPAVEWQRRSRWFRRRKFQLVFVAPSRWICSAARARCPQHVRVIHVPNCVPLDTYRPLAERQHLREALGLPRAGFVFLAGAASLSDPHKGFADLAAAVDRLRSVAPGRWTMAFFGATGKGVKIPPDCIFLGTIRDERFLALYYAVADAFVHPATSDNFPNTLLEAMACGTPCITSDAGGCAEIVRDGVTGYVVPRGDVDALAAAMRRLLQTPPDVLASMRSESRRLAEEEYSPAGQAGRMAEIYCELFEAPQDG